MKKILIIVTVLLTMSCTDIVYTSGYLDDKRSVKGNYEVTEIESYFGNDRSLYSLRMINSEGNELDVMGKYDFIQIVDSSGAFSIGDKIRLNTVKVD